MITIRSRDQHSRKCANNFDTDRISSKCLKCNTYDKEFSAVVALHQHSTVHGSVSSFACKSCGKCFKHESSFNAHRCHLHQGKEVNVVALQNMRTEWVTCEVQILLLRVPRNDSLIVLPVVAAAELCQ